MRDTWMVSANIHPSQWPDEAFVRISDGLLGSVLREQKNLKLKYRPEASQTSLNATNP